MTSPLMNKDSEIYGISGRSIQLVSSSDQSRRQFGGRIQGRRPTDIRTGVQDVYDKTLSVRIAKAMLVLRSQEKECIVYHVRPSVC